jgi:hypothetical protein
VANGVLQRATRRDRRLVSWGEFGTVVTANLLFVTSVAAAKHAAGGVWWVLVGALAVLCPLLGLHLGRSFLATELEQEPRLWRMVGWRLLCFVFSALPLALVLARPAM